MDWPIVVALLILVVLACLLVWLFVDWHDEPDD